MDALIGYTGFVGSSLLRQRQFEGLYRSSNIEDLQGGSYDTIICAGAPAQKWLANKEPDRDRNGIEKLINSLLRVQCDQFILISTVDVFHTPEAVDETDLPRTDGLHPYGLHRLMLEQFVKERFKGHLIARLPGLVGPGLRKNIIFDIRNDNNVHLVDSRAIFQFYPMVNLWYDLKTALEAGLNLVHFATEPIKVSEVSRLGFGLENANITSGQQLACYDVRTKHAAAFGSEGNYLYHKREIILAVRAYAQSEPVQASK